MDVATLLSVVQTLLAALASSELKEVWSMWDYKSNLDELMNVVVTIKKVLLDAEAKYDQLSEETLQYIEELSFALYDADDLLDEFVTLVKQKQLLEEGKFVKKVRLFFSRNNPLGVANRMSKEVKKIMTKLDSMATRHNKFGLSLDHTPIRKRGEETCSYTDTDIIGRDEDVEKIVGMLLDSDVSSSSLTIVGMGGLGKTALAQLVYNHEKIKSYFPLRLWICVSDHDRSNLDAKAILAQILDTAGQNSNGCSMEGVVSRVREVLLGKRSLIVLDDLWTESRDKLQKLLGHLVGGEVGSQIVVTTRSKETAKIVGRGLTYELQGLSDEDSWRLFQLIAFDKGVDLESPSGFYFDKINIGKNIIKICANVPLAIRVVGGLLYEQDKSKWLKVQKFGLANLREGENGIMPILKLSYHNLESSLRSCFSYCSLYPKDFEIEKETLISLWIAQGYVVPLGKGQSVEDASEEYFSMLLRRCFFQDGQKNDFGGVHSFKLHDLMHDVALEVSKKEICPASPCTRDMDKVARHVSLSNEQHANFGHINPHIRTYLHIYTYGKAVDIGRTPARLVNYKRLRTLDFSHFNVEALPDSIGKLIHLRYLNLSWNKIEVLPNSITKLYNLQTLDLIYCWKSKELPNNFSNLVNLRVLKLHGCDNLTFMPSGLSKLNNLYELSGFHVGATRLNRQSELEDLKALKNLRGSIEIVIHFPISEKLATDNTTREGGYIRDKENLYQVYFKCKHQETNEGATYYEEELLGALQPHENLKDLSLSGYQGVRMPRWVIEDKFLPNLVKFELYDCSELKCLPALGNLQNLKHLRLEYLPELEYMETPLEIVSVHGEESGERLHFFPCLESLILMDLPKFKGWGRSGERGGITEFHQSYLVFSQLISLKIYSCWNLTSLPGCPNVKKLRLYNFSEKLHITSNTTSCLKLEEVSTDNLSWLDSTEPIESLQSLTIYRNKDIENLGDFRRVFQACSSSLRELELLHCPKLKSLSGGLSYLTALKQLDLYKLPILNLAEIEGDVGCDDMPWETLCHTLSYLKIVACPELKTFPKWMRKLTSLQQLSVSHCPTVLYERCENSNGEDWPNIQHIPCIEFREVGEDWHFRGEDYYIIY